MAALAGEPSPSPRREARFAGGGPSGRCPTPMHISAITKKNRRNAKKRSKGYVKKHPSTLVISRVHSSGRIDDRSPKADSHVCIALNRTCADVQIPN